MMGMLAYWFLITDKVEIDTAASGSAH
jgi:hypothetical protein